MEVASKLIDTTKSHFRREKLKMVRNNEYTSLSKIRKPKYLVLFYKIISQVSHDDI